MYYDAIHTIFYIIFIFLFKRTYFRLTICLLWTYRIKIITLTIFIIGIGYDAKYIYYFIGYFQFYSLFFYFYFSTFLKHYGLFIYILKLYNPYHIILISGWNKRIKLGREGPTFLEVEFLNFIFFN
jgi:hypothetical protein